jgi:hypothetical protein
MTARVDRVNRVLLILLGLLCIAAGVMIFLVGGGVFGDDQRHKVLLRLAMRNWVDDHAWLWIIIGVASGILALLAIRWLWSQASTKRVLALQLEPDRSHGHTRLAAGALNEAVAEELERIRGVSGASARLLGSPRDPLLRLDVKLNEDADLGFIRSRIEEDTVPHARTAASLNQLPVQLRLSVASELRRQII